MGHWHDIQAELKGPTKELRDQIPETWSGFTQLHRHALADGVIPGGLKEVIALAIAVTEQCDGCIAYHARAAARKGATPEQVAEGLGVALLMSGGPGTVYGPRAWEAFSEFTEG